MLIYKITNLVNGKVYVGQTVVSLNRRWTQHRNSKKSTPLYAAIRKYGVDNFKVEAVCSALKPENLNFLERQFIADFGCTTPKGYNLTDGGDSAFARAEETKRKQSVAMLGHSVSEHTRQKIAQALKGRPGARRGAVHTESAKAKISDAGRGRITSDATKAKQANAHLGAKAYNSKVVVCVETGIIYGSTGEAARALNLQQSSISAVCRGVRKSTGRLTFKFVVEEAVAA